MRRAPPSASRAPRCAHWPPRRSASSTAPLRAAARRRGGPQLRLRRTRARRRRRAARACESTSTRPPRARARPSAASAPGSAAAERNRSRGRVQVVVVGADPVRARTAPAHGPGRVEPAAAGSSSARARAVSPASNQPVPGVRHPSPRVLVAGRRERDRALGELGRRRRCAAPARDGCRRVERVGDGSVRARSLQARGGGHAPPPPGTTSATDAWSALRSVAGRWEYAASAISGWANLILSPSR